MKTTLILFFLITVSTSWCQIEYPPIAGDLLKHWNTAGSSCSADVWDADSIELPNGIDERPFLILQT
ncbi:MAG: hypothetical protein K8S15_01080 [Candidatus Aegiribacteria sp.]|nr:hypothetical protein [Candidatus Aegiribacteria sp.]